MKTVLKKLTKGLFCMALAVSTVIANSTCWYKLYQEELPKELDSLRKHD